MSTYPNERTMRRAGSPRWRKALSFLACVPTLLLAVAMAWSCAAPPDDTRLTLMKDRPDFAQFKDGKVSLFLERRCGTLDCHGRIERPLRIYGLYGLRLPNDAGLVPSQGDTSEAELLANYRSVLGLEPEQMNRVMTGEDPSILLLLSKPLAYDPDRPGTDKGVRHRGGPQIVQNQEGYTCLYKWLKREFGDDGRAACEAAAKQLQLD